MSTPDDFIQRMPLAELAHFVEDLSRKFGVTDAEMEEKMRRQNEGKGPDA